MINTSVEISDSAGGIMASIFRKLDLSKPMVEVYIVETVDKEDIEARMLLERQEVISFAHGLLALAESI